MTSAVETATEIRPFRVDMPQEAIDDLRRRIAATRLPEREVEAGQPLRAWQEPELYTAGVRAGFRSLR